MNITLPPALHRLVRDKVSAGLYATESDLVCEALRREFAAEAVIQWTREQAQAGFQQLDAGECVEMTRAELKQFLITRRSAAPCA